MIGTPQRVVGNAARFLAALFLTAIVVATCPPASAGDHRSKPPSSTGSSSGKSQTESASGAASAQNCLPITEAAKHIRKKVCVTGTVIRVEEGSHGVTFLDFCPDYRTCPFTVVVFPSDLRNVGDVHQLQGRVVMIQGRVEEYDDRAEIILRHAQQLGDNAKLPTAMPKEYDVERQGHFSAGTFRAKKAKKSTRKAQGQSISIIDAEDP